jgi:rare lipoprotein A (RlpA)-like double-psi beta-barrel protein
VRRPKVVASVALIALLATVAVPSPMRSSAPSIVASVDPGRFEPVKIEALVRGTTMTTQPLDPAARSAGMLDEGSTMLEPAQRDEPPPALLRPAQRTATPGTVGTTPPNGWHHDPDISWFGPGFYGNGTACGQTMTKTLVGVAHRTLPCGTLVTFRYKGRTVTVPVVDRGPYVAGRTWDLTKGACTLLAHCFTGTIDWKLGAN